MAKKTTREAYNSFEHRCHEEVDRMYSDMKWDDREQIKIYFTEVFASLYSEWKNENSRRK